MRDLLVKSGDYFVLTRGFGGANAIKISVTESGKVRQIIFEYGSEKTFDQRVASYTKTLGNPVKQESFSSAIFTSRLAAWDDGKTRFEIVERSEDKETIIKSVLIDKLTGN